MDYCRAAMMTVFLLIAGAVLNDLYGQKRTNENSKRSTSSQKVNQINLIPLDQSAMKDNNTDDSLTIKVVIRGNCKSFSMVPYIFSEGDSRVKLNKESKPITNTPFISVHGTVNYDFLYRSYIDTPFAQHDFQQHTVQSSLSITVKDKYPINLNLSNRQSNSPFFRNFVDIDLHFDQSAFLKKAKMHLLEKINAQTIGLPHLQKLDSELLKEVDKFNHLSYALKQPDVLQRLMKERERIYYKEKLGKARLNDSLHHDFDFSNLLSNVNKKWTKPDFTDTVNSSLDGNSYTAQMDQKRRELDSILQRISLLKAKTDSLKNVLNTKLYSVKQKVSQVKDFKELEKIEEGFGIDQGKEGFADKILKNTKSIGIGRSIVNYSELTVSNVSLTGFNIEYNPKTYVALAAGKIDYGFRNFFGKSTRKLGQNILIGRFGIGDKDKKAVILSAYTGKKYNYSSLLADTISNRINIVGYSVEGILRKNERTGLSVEVAKTTRPVTGSFGANKELTSLSDFSDHSNIGISLKGATRLLSTDTKIDGFYRKTGKNFQSFNLFSYNTDQTAWLLKVDQPLFKKKMDLSAGLRRNDFVNPFTTKTFKSSTVFKSFQLTARFPKWPVVSVGYYPGSQIYFIDKERVIENAYYIQNASLLYTYTLGNTNIVSSVMYNRYSSKGTDSGFIAYDGATYMSAHSLSLGKFQLQGSYTYTDQELLQYYTIEGNVDYSITRKIRAGVGSKYNKVSGGDTYYGNRGLLTIDVKHLGMLQLQYEKSYLPTTQQTLFPVEVGRLSWFKSF